MREPRGVSLAIKMTLLVMGGVVLVFALILGDSYLSSRRIILKQAEGNARNLANAMAYRIEQEFRAIAKVPGDMAVFLEIATWDKTVLHNLIKQMVANNKEVFGSAAAFEPFALDRFVKAQSPYYYKSESGIKSAQLGTADYDYFQWDWYQIPRELGRPVWSEPYLDAEVSGALMSTYSAPFFWPEKAGQPRRVRGIITADISLVWLTELISSIKAGQTGYGFIISHNGVFITYPDEKMILKESLFSLAVDNNDPQLREVGRMMLHHDSGFMRLESTLTPTPVYLAFTRAPSTGWSLAVLFPEEELLHELRELNRRDSLLAGAGGILLFLVVLFIARSITGPLRKVSAATAKVAEGDLDVDLSDIKGRDEVGRLARAFTRMSSDLKKYIQDLTETTAAKERIESELNIASQIQKSNLPSTFPPFPNHCEFDLFAVMQPAREVGGDFYDFFFINDNTLALVIADVSGKGVPAALFMMVSRTLIKSIARQGKSPAQALAEANDLLCQGNDAAMFVTVFLGFYDIYSGRMTFANGGHNPALILKADGRVRTFAKAKGVALGFMPDLEYQTGEEELEPGDALVLYTDGVTEAFSPREEMFGEERFKELLGTMAKTHPQELCQKVVLVLDDFQKERQFDDITLLSLRRERKSREDCPN
ncbi:MAG: SpoIIE family protein phosphatase [Pseudomonadota bacterium]